MESFKDSEEYKKLVSDLNKYINMTLDPLLHLKIDPEDGEIVMEYPENRDCHTEDVNNKEK